MFSQMSARVATDDPSDWPQEFQELCTLDNLLRCSICFEYFNIAVMATGCCHNYCSLCARKHITYKAQCPSCPAEMHPGDLKCNRALDEIVRIFVALRPKLLLVLKEHKEVKKKEKTSHKDRTTFVSPYAKAGSSQRKTARSNNSNNNNTSTNQKQSRTKDDDDFEPIKSKKRKDLDQSISGSSTTTLTGSDVDSGPGDDSGFIYRRKGGQMGQCPVCLKKIPLKAINKHLDACLVGEGHDRRKSERSAKNTSSTEPQSKRMRTRSHANVKTTQRDSNEDGDEGSQAVSDGDSDVTRTADDNTVPEHSQMYSRIEGSPDLEPNEIAASCHRATSNELLPTDVKKRRKKLPDLIVSGLSEKQLRCKLKDNGLSSKGDKKTLQNRLKQYILLYNSQCDALEPKPVADIIKEVERTETAQKRLDKGPVVIRTFDRSKTDQEKEKFNEDYLSKHKDHFESLIKDVKSRKKKSKESESLWNETSTKSRRTQDGASQSHVSTSQNGKERTDCTDTSEDEGLQNNSTYGNIELPNFHTDKDKATRPKLGSSSSNKFSVSTTNIQEDESASGKLLTTMPCKETIKQSQSVANEFSLSSRLSQTVACAKGQEKSLSSVHEDEDWIDLSPRPEKSFTVKSKEVLGSPMKPINLEDDADDSSESDSGSKNRINISNNRIDNSQRNKNELNKSIIKSSQREQKDASFNSSVIRHGASVGPHTGMKQNSSTNSKKKTVTKKWNAKSSKKIDPKSKKGKTMRAQNITSFFNKVTSDKGSSRTSDDMDCEILDLDHLDNETEEIKHQRSSQNKSKCEQIEEDREISFCGRSSPLFDDSEGSGGHSIRPSRDYNSSQSRETVAVPPSPPDLDLSEEDSDTLLL